MPIPPGEETLWASPHHQWTATQLMPRPSGPGLLPPPSPSSSSYNLPPIQPSPWTERARGSAAGRPVAPTRSCCYDAYGGEACLLSKTTTSSAESGLAPSWATCCGATGPRPCSPTSYRRQIARPCASACLVRTSSPSATPRDTSASWPTPVLTVAPRCSSGATRRQACAVSTTAGSSTPKAPASTCRRNRPRATSRARCASTPTPRTSPAA
jgi:hypothetical protein